MIGDEDYEKNVREFIDKHGIEGFLTLFFARYLLKILKSEVKSKSRGPEIADDPGVLFYFKGKEIESFSDMEEYEDQILEECKKKAREMVSNLKDDEKFEGLFKGNFEKLEDPKLKDRFKDKMHELFEKWKSEE